MRRVGKILLYIFLSLIFLIVLLTIVAAVSENKIAKLAIEQAGKATNIGIELNDVEFSLIRSFPLARIQCNQLTVLTPPTSETSGNDTLFHADKLFLSVQVKPLIDGFFDVRKVEVNQAVAYYKVDSTGISNLDFLKDTTVQSQSGSSTSAIHLNLKELRVEDLVCEYNDQKQNARARVNIKNMDLTGRINDTEYQGNGELSAVLSDCLYPGTNAHLMQQLDIDFKGDYHNDTLFIDRTNLVLDNDAKLAGSGKLVLQDSIWAKLIIQAEKLDIGTLQKYLPGKLLSGYGISSLKGMLVADASVQGKLLGKELPVFDVAFKFTNGNVQYRDYPAIKTISFEGEADDDKENTLAGTQLKIGQLSFETDSSHFSFRGTVNNLLKPKFNIESKVDLKISEFASFIPDSLVQKPTGQVVAEFSTRGVLPDSISNEYIHTILNDTELKLQLINIDARKDSTLEVKNLNGSIEYHPGTVAISGLNGKLNTEYAILDRFELDAAIIGDPLKIDSLECEVSRFYAKMDSNTLIIDGRIKNLSHPEYAISGSIDANLAQLQRFLPDSMFSSVSGSVHSGFHSEASINLDSISDQIIDVLMEKSVFDLNMQNIQVTSADPIMNFNGLSGHLDYKNDSFRIDRLQVNYRNMNIEMNKLLASRVYQGAFQNKPVEITVVGDFYVDTIDYENLAIFMDENPSETSADNDKDTARYTYKIKGNFRAGHLQYEKANFENIKTKFLVKEGHYVIDSMSANAFNGSALSSAKIEMQANNEMIVWFKTDVKNMDVVKLVDAFGNYLDYEDIQKNNIRGTLTSVMDGKIVMKDFEPDYNELSLKGELTLENGALFNVKPVMEVEQISGVGIKNLDSLYFSTLSSSLFLFRNNLYIPRTEIRTSSFDAMFLGMYSFGEDYAYHIRLFLGEVLSSKSKANLRKQAQEGGFTEDDEKDLTKGRTSIYVVSKLENGKEKAGFDNKKDRLNMVARVNLQKQMLDMRFHPALVNYKTEE